MEKIMGMQEVADRVGASVHTVRGWAQDGHLPAKKLSKNGPWRIFESDLEDWLEGKLRAVA